MTNDDGRGSEIDRRRLLKGIGATTAGATAATAGCLDQITGGTSTETTPTETPTDTPTPTNTPTDTPTEEPEPAWKQNLPTSQTTYINTLEEAYAYNFSADDIVEALEGAGEDPHRQAEHLSEHLIGDGPDDLVKDITYDLAKAFSNQYEEVQEQTDYEVANFVFDTFTSYSTQTNETAIVQPVINNGVLRPVLHEGGRHGNTQKPGETDEGDTGNLPRYRDPEDTRSNLPQDTRTIQTIVETARDNNGSESVIRRIYLEQWSDILLGDLNEYLRPRSYEDGNQVFDSRMGRTDFSIYEQLHQEYMDSQHVDKIGVTDFIYENGEFSFRRGEMIMGDPLSP